MTPKDKHRLKLVEFIANPDNDFPDRATMAAICGISKRALHQHFSPEEFAELEADAMDLRRKHYSRFFPKIDKALISEAEEGNIAAIKLAYQRLEGWSEKQEHQITAPEPITINYLPYGNNDKSSSKG